MGCEVLYLKSYNEKKKLVEMPTDEV